MHLTLQVRQEEVLRCDLGQLITKVYAVVAHGLARNSNSSVVRELSMGLRNKTRNGLLCLFTFPFEAYVLPQNKVLHASRVEIHTRPLVTVQLVH